MLSRAKNKTRLISSSATNGRQLALAQQVEDHGFCVIERGLEPSVLRRLQDAFHQHLAAPRRQWEASQTGTDATCTGEAPPRILGLPDDWLLLDKLPSIHQSFRLWQSSWALTSSSRSASRAAAIPRRSPHCQPNSLSRWMAARRRPRGATSTGTVTTLHLGRGCGRRPHHTGDRPSIMLRCDWGSFWRKATRAMANTAARLNTSGELRIPLLRQLAGVELEGSIHWEPPPKPKPASLPEPLARLSTRYSTSKL